MDNLGACDRERWGTTYTGGDNAECCSESECISDISDTEVDSYLNNDKEKYYKKIIWEKLNQKYLEEQNAKKIAASANVPKTKREDGRKRATAVKENHSTAQTSPPVSSKKRASSRVNYEALNKLLNEPATSDNPKRSRIESECDQNIGTNSVESPASDDYLSTSQNEDEEKDWEESQDYSTYYSNQEEDYADFDDDDDIF